MGNIIIQALPKNGSTFFNYKKSFIILLLVVCNANYEFTLADIGETGRQSDVGIYNNSKLGMAMDRNLLNISEPATINERSVSKKFPFVFAADEAFALKTFMLRSFHRRNDLKLYELIFNYRVSCARRVIGNTFGILTCRLRIFRRSIIGET